MNKEELAEYLGFAIEMRRRVKEQLRRINPTEFAKTDLTYIDKATGEEFSAPCPELVDVGASETGHSIRPPQSQSVVKPNQTNSPIGTFYGYELVRSLDSGGMAEAYMARNCETGETVFVKRVRNQSADKAALEREMRIYEKLMRTSTEHVLAILDFMRDDDYTAIVTEFADGGDLYGYVTERDHGLSVAEARDIALNIANAVRELHDQEIVHRDLKPQNVLAFSGCWKLSDFGISKSTSHQITKKTFQQYGTLGFLAK